MTIEYLGLPGYRDGTELESGRKNLFSSLHKLHPASVDAASLLFPLQPQIHHTHKVREVDLHPTMRTDKALPGKHTPSALVTWNTNTTAYLLTMHFMTTMRYCPHRPDMSHPELIVTSPHHPRETFDIVVPLLEHRRLLLTNSQICCSI